MPRYSLIIYSKNKITLQNFLMFLQKKLSVYLQLVLKYTKKEKVKKEITILKSPHINKTAQEKYKYIVYSYIIKTYSFKIQKYILFLKKLRNNLFSDIKLKMKIIIEKKSFNIKINCFKINNYKLNLIRIKKNNTRNVKNKMFFIAKISKIKVIKINNIFSNLLITIKKIQKKQVQPVLVEKEKFIFFPGKKIKFKTCKISRTKKRNYNYNYWILFKKPLKSDLLKIQEWNSKEYKKKINYIYLKTYVNLIKKTLNYVKINDCIGEFEIHKKI